MDAMQVAPPAIKNMAIASSKLLVYRPKMHLRVFFHRYDQV